MNKKIAIVCLGLSILVMYAAAYQAPPEQAPGRIVVRAGRLLDVKTGKTLTDQAIVIEGDKIVSVGPASAASASASTINLPNATVLPGLIDAHTHITFDPS